MTELIEQTAPQNVAWILRGEPATNGRALRIELGPTDETAVAPGDWAVIVGSGDAVRIVGRILRVRSDPDGRTIYFDQALAVDPAVPLTALGLTAPSAPATRLPWDDFLRVLPSLGAASTDAVPLIQDVTYVRDLLELSVRDDLLGPAEGPHELIKDMSVRDRYLVGKLAPRRPGDDQIAQVEPASAADESGDLEEERTASLHEPGAEFPSATGRVEPEDDALDEIDTTNNQSLVPSSMGLAWRPEVRNLFGRVDQECGRHGLLWPSHDCGTGHRAKGSHPAASVKPVRAIRPPDLIIQDEFHLISGPLGTMVGLYETAVDELSSWPLGDTKVRPKVVASTATVRRADDQVRNVFMRRISVFPPSGLDVEDNFFSVQRPISEKPGRRYMGICAPGSSRPAVLIRTYTAFLTAAQALFDRFGPVADPYMTLVGYFNSLRELGGMKRLAEDDVQTRSFRVNMSLVDRPGLAQRRVEEVSELTSRVSSQDIPRYLDQLEVPFEGAFDHAQGKWITNRKPGEARPIDAVLATNMLSVGVDGNGGAKLGHVSGGIVSLRAE